MTGVGVARGYVDRGYRGHGLNHRGIFVSGQRRGVTATIRRALQRRSAIEPVIAHMKVDGRLDRNFLAGVRGDATNALLCGAGYNLRLILDYLRRLLRALLLALAGNHPLDASLGLAPVSAVTRLHWMDLLITDANPGCCITLVRTTQERPEDRMNQVAKFANRRCADTRSAVAKPSSN